MSTPSDVAQDREQSLKGTFSDDFAAVTDELQAQLDSGNERGASLVINVDGENVVDVWGGFADTECTRPWESDTIANVWSTTKTVTYLSMLMLADRGLIDFDTPVATYWPEFAQNGKEAITVGQVMSHTSGVSGWDQPVTVEDLFDVDSATARLATQAPWWEPGTASGYHSINQGHLLGEVLRRVTGITLRDFVAQEIAGPLGADFQIGAAESDWDRIAPLTYPLDNALDLVGLLGPDHLATKTLAGPPLSGTDANRPEWRRKIIGAANGHGNARSVNKVLSTITLGGTVDGVRLLSEEMINKALTVQIDDVDQVLMTPVRRGLGYGLLTPESAEGTPARDGIAYWGGWGGSIIVMDTERRTTFSYVMNKMGTVIFGNDRSLGYLKTFFEITG